MPVVSVKNVSVFNGHTFEIWPSCTFESNDDSPGRIISSESPADRTINGLDCTLIPGLIDAKVDTDAAAWALAEFAAAGVTTVIDASSDTADAVAMAGTAGRTPVLPTYLATGSTAGVPGWENLGVFPFRAVEMVSSPVDAEEFVARRVTKSKLGKLIKVVADTPGLDDQNLQAVVNAAHRHGNLVIAQASQLSAYRRAIAMGCDVVTPVPVDGELDSELASQLRDKGIAVIPTLSFLKRALPRAGHPPSSYDKAAAAVKVLNEAKVPICAGTSANEVEGLSVEFGVGIHEELLLLVQAGLTNIEALQTATSVPSRVFRLSDRGTIEVGKRPDLILLRGKVQDDLPDIKQIKEVWIDGVEVSGNAERLKQN